MPDGSSQDSWTLIDVSVDEARSELVSEFLWRRGAQGIEERASDRVGWVCLRTSLGSNPSDLGDVLTDEFPGVSMDLVRVDRSTADTWRDHARPTWIDDEHVVVPAWVDPPAASIRVRIEPDDQFGLGNHETTVLAARLMLQAAQPGERWLDVGTGSGVLAVLGAVSCGTSFLATDIAPGSRRTVERNVAMNQCADRVSWCASLGDVPDSSIDGVVANILAPVLQEIAPEVRRVIAPGGTLVLSGMLESQVESVRRRYLPSVEIARTAAGSWTAVALRLEHESR